MLFTALKLVNFRSYGEQLFKFSPQLNLIVGPNGSGKTNLLEALYVLAATKSFRGKDQELVRQGAQQYALKAKLEGNLNIAIRYEPGPPARKALQLGGELVK